MNKIIRPIIITVCIVLLAFSLFQIGLYLKDYRNGKDAYAKAEETFGIPPVTDLLSAPANVSAGTEDEPEEEIDPLLIAAAEYFKDCDFEKLWEVNDECLAWIVIPGTNISYPVCQCDDNQYYLEHTFDKAANRLGTIFVDYRVAEPFACYNTILYGHHMRNQTMFSALMSFQEKEFWEENPYVYICTPDNLYVYEIYAAFRGDPNGLSYHVGFSSDEKKQSFIDYTRSCAYYDTQLVPDTSDSFLTLSTCTGNGHSQRMIVHSRLRASHTRAGLLP